MHLALLISTVQQREKKNLLAEQIPWPVEWFFYTPFKDKNDWVASNILSNISSPGTRFLKVTITFQHRKPVLCHVCILDQSFKNVENDTCNETISYRSNIIQFMSQNLFYCSKGFDLKICLRAPKVTGPFEKQASGQFGQCISDRIRQEIGNE